MKFVIGKMIEWVGVSKKENMFEEKFDIVDENNELTGLVKTRAEAHGCGLWHRTVHVYYFYYEDDRYYFLVHKRAKTKDLNPNKWDTRFGGHLKANESVEKALVNEIREEIGLNSKISDYIKGPIRKRNNYPNNEFSYIYYYLAKKDIYDLSFEDNEVQEVKWMEAEDILESLRNKKIEWSGNADGFEYIYEELRKLVR